MRYFRGNTCSLSVGLLALMTGTSLLVTARPALAADQATDPRLTEIEQALQAQESRLDSQQKQLADQQKTLATQQAEIDKLRAERDGLLADIRAGRSDAPAGSDTAVPYASLSPNTSSAPGPLSGSGAATSGTRIISGKTRKMAANAAAFTAVAINADTGVGAPSYTSGAH